MSEPVPDLSTEWYPHDGWGLFVDDLPGIRFAARVRPVELLVPDALPAPVREARIAVRPRPGGGVTVTAAARWGGQRRTGFSVLGNDVVGALLARRVDAGDRRALRAVGGLESAVAEVSRRLGRPAPRPRPRWSESGPPATVTRSTDATTGLALTMRRHPGAVVIEAATDDLTGPQLNAVVAALMAELRAATGRSPLAALRLAPDHPPAEAGAVTLDQVGGLDPVVAEFRQIALSFRNPDAMRRWGAQRPQGILLYGPAGTGKTMLAHALAHEIGGAVREIRTPEILDKWLGASERNLKRIFREARRYTTPTVLLFDEFDSIIGYAGPGTDSGSHAVNAVAGLFKQEMNALIADNPQVIVVATTNFPELIDESLVRSGRFDLRFDIPRPDRAARAQILTRMIRDLITTHESPDFRMFADDVEPGALAAAADSLTGADLREVLRRAQLDKAMTEARGGRPSDPINQADLLARIADVRTALEP